MNIKLSPPWLTFGRKIRELFKEDKDITIKEDDDEITIIVSRYEKTEALKQILPKEKEFGNVKIKINIEYKRPSATVEDIYKAAFENNPAFKYTFAFDAGTNTITYVVFDKKVVQYWNDDMSDPHGVTSTLFEDIARDTFVSGNGVLFSTDSEGSSTWLKKYFKNHATPEEIEEWEKYNGEGSFENGSKIEDTLINKSNYDKPTEVKDQKTFKTIFNRK